MAKPVNGTAFSNYLRAHSPKAKHIRKRSRQASAKAARREWEAMNGPVEVRKISK